MTRAPRVVLTSFSLADAASINRWKNDQELQALSGENATGESLAQSEARIQRWQNSDPARLLHFAIRPRDHGALLGFCHLAEIDLAQHTCKVGIVLGERSTWGQGYGREAVLRLLEEATGRGLFRVIAEVQLENERSARLFAGAGFALVGKQRAEAPDGRPLEELIFAWGER